jgi:putative flippase GtrA
MKILILYVLFAGVATLVNIACQDISLMVWAGYLAIPISMSVGTAGGLVVKYVLDKKFIFQYQSQGVADDGRKFFIYSLMGLITTAIFWLFELGFEFAFQNKGWRYFGAVLGLAIGYFIKYQLDSRYVFGRREA